MFDKLRSLFQPAIVAAPEQQQDIREDSWVNPASGMGIAGIDKTASTTYSSMPFYLSQSQLENMFQRDWLSRKICMRPAEDATRKWLRIDGDADKAILKEMERLKFRQKIRTAMAWGDLFGGAGIVLITQGDDPEEELIPERVTKLLALEVYDRYWLSPVTYDYDIYSPMYMQPLIYQTATGQRFHRSRVLKFIGAELTRDRMIANNWWGGSKVECAFQAIKDFQGTTNDVRHIMTELNIGVLKVSGLDLKGAMGGSIQEGMQRRLNGGNLMKSVYRMMAIDKDKEDFQFVNRTVTGVPEVMDRFMTTVAASIDMTELVLFGKSPTGLNASQEEQKQVWYDKVDARREDEVAPNIQVVMDVLTKGNSPDWEFEQLWKMSDTQKADVMQKSAAAVQAVVDVAGLTPEEARRQLNTLEAWDLEEDDAPAPDMLVGGNETY